MPPAAQPPPQAATITVLVKHGSIPSPVRTDGQALTPTTCTPTVRLRGPSSSTSSTLCEWAGPRGGGRKGAGVDGHSRPAGGWGPCAGTCPACTHAGAGRTSRTDLGAGPRRPLLPPPPRPWGQQASPPHLPRPQGQLASRHRDGLRVTQQHAEQVGVRILRLLGSPGLPAAGPAGKGAPSAGRRHASTSHLCSQLMWWVATRVRGRAVCWGSRLQPASRQAGGSPVRWRFPQVQVVVQVGLRGRRQLPQVLQQASTHSHPRPGRCQVL